MATQDRQPTQKDDESLDFASAMTQLETLVERLESGELTLEESLKAFEQGVALTRDAQKRLDEAELKVRSLTENADGGMQLSPFDIGEEPGER
ncbi:MULTISPECIES: exodeoxyribonuclease VII small subunit [Halomonas]|mgnify:FL=1|jgi:exodeoxyribonuclease VII small subunit|uniref:Exodeoxyribonuclease 7 small subunit n=3 Tax=Halomonas TaxID=2745 RepID=A0AAU7KJD9_9GAMM|nr:MULTISPECIES: exodeoxyribonuclease VII small subunit [Halomonas]MBR9771507.1 exodeoxyribonuclease VII small subunit [Gammaproteobacteria bacterium]HAR08563.1 exodeoxyribonuclease VII small subunit [Cobetia sp.]KJZ08753.1 exodeoxyribonuclease VII [Halomonas sp. S2151]MAR73198.1 exodeoxyribonuclease VII small subunit [Halomonas sp.]MBR9879990.1 exodeoxyribonuclease VII small subunit [Gammaproteobacteria bacterium]|tara:strand:+ start:2329 stop:2607 length:279 start_codon:yes stop_codon:yes gene_type:complete